VFLGQRPRACVDVRMPVLLLRGVCDAHMCQIPGPRTATVMTMDIVVAVVTMTVTVTVVTMRIMMTVTMMTVMPVVVARMSEAPHTALAIVRMVSVVVVTRV
jgi:hypothetical protein